MATAFFFGETNRLLYGVYHPPRIRAGHRPAVLLCNPFGEEAVRTHRVYRILADRLADIGAPVLRFDYYGAGDSMGVCKDAHLTGFADDILEAHEELRGVSAAGRVVWVGLRLGATAAGVAFSKADVGAGVDGLIIWDPVMTGSEYLDELADAQQSFTEDVLAHSNMGTARSNASPVGPTQALGFDIGEAMRRDLSDFDFANAKVWRRVPKMVAIVTADEASADKRLDQLLEDRGGQVVRHRHEGDPAWNSDAALNSYTVPTRALSQIVKTVEDWR